MLIQVLWLLGGLLLLLFAGDALVRGAVAGALKSGVSPLVAGIVVVGFGTSLPEVLVSVDGALRGAEDLAHGNIVGSNIANICLVLAIPAIMAPIATDLPGLRRSMTATVLATIVWIGVTRWFGLNPLIGGLFLTSLVGYIVYIILSARREHLAGIEVQTSDEVEETDASMPLWKTFSLVLIGLIGLTLGARITINAGVNIAQALHVSEALIGLTLLAIGTSLPEIGAGVAAAMRKQGDVALGNVVGSNMFNLLAAGGAIALVKPQVLGMQFHLYSHWVLAFMTALIALYVYTKRPIGRLSGIAMLVIYGAYVTGLINGTTIESVFPGIGSFLSP